MSHLLSLVGTYFALYFRDIILGRLAGVHSVAKCHCDCINLPLYDEDSFINADESDCGEDESSDNASVATTVSINSSSGDLDSTCDSSMVKTNNESITKVCMYLPT